MTTQETKQEFHRLLNSIENLVIEYRNETDDIFEPLDLDVFILDLEDQLKALKELYNKSSF